MSQCNVHLILSLLSNNSFYEIESLFRMCSTSKVEDLKMKMFLTLSAFKSHFQRNGFVLLIIDLDILNLVKGYA